MPSNDSPDPIDTPPPAGTSHLPYNFAQDRLFSEFESFDYDTDRGTYRALYHPKAVAPSTAVVSALAAISDTRPVEMDSLHTAVDTDCLNSLGSMRPVTGDIEIAFQLNDYCIRVKSSGSIQIRHGNEVKTAQAETQARASSTGVGLDETFNVLRHPYRRYVLYYLRTNSEIASVETLTTVLAEELQEPTPTPWKQTPEIIEAALHHTHLPILAEVGLITFDQDSQSIKLGRINGHGQVIAQAARLDRYAPSVAGD